MNISSRFSEFGMTGAFFWIAQIVYFSIVHRAETLSNAPAWITYLHQYQALIDQLPQIFLDVSGSLLTAFALIGIFVTGLVLNLFGSYFFLFEDLFFSRHLDRNHGWLDRMIGNCPGAVNDDYRTLREAFGTRIFVSPQQGYRRARLSGHCTRVQSFLFSYVHVFGDNGTPEILGDHVHLWRTARAIGITFWLLSIEMLLFHLFDEHEQTRIATQAIVLTAAGLFLLGIYTTLRAYNRLCHTLFTLACATFGRQNPQTG